MNTTPTVFHCSAKAMSKVVFFSAIPVSIFLAASLILIDHELNVNFTLLALALALACGGVAGVVFLVVMSLLVCRLYPIELGEAGIRAYSFWGQRRFIQWHEIEAVRPYSLFNLPYLRLYGRAPSKPVWMAIFISNPSEFGEAMTRCAPKDSPILAHLNECAPAPTSTHLRKAAFVSLLLSCVLVVGLLVASRKSASSLPDPEWKARGGWEKLSRAEKSTEQVDAYLAKNPGDIVRLVGVLNQYSIGERPEDERLEPYTLQLIDKLPSAGLIFHANGSRIHADHSYRDRLVARLEEQVAKGQTNHGVFRNLASICERGTWVVEPERRERFLRYYSLPPDTKLADKPDPVLLEKAIRYYEAATVAAKGDPFYEGFHLEALAELLEGNKRFDQAAKICERALPLTGDTSRSSLLVTYGRSLKSVGKLDEAETQLKKVRKADRKSYEQGPGCATMEAETLLGHIALQQGDLKKACQRLKATTDVNQCCHNTTKGFPLSLASELLKRGETDAVIAFCQRVLTDFTPKQPETAALLAKAQETRSNR